MSGRAVGIDLSLTATGIALDDGDCMIVGMSGVTNMSWEHRLRTIGVMVSDICAAVLDHIDGQGVDVAVCIEGLDQANPYGGQIERSYMWCSVVQALIIEGVQVYVAPSAQVKMYATGNGAAHKEDVIEAVATQWFFQVGRDDNKADAAACCAIARAKLGIPFTEVPLAQERALAKVMPVTRAPEPKKRKPAKKAVGGSVVAISIDTAPATVLDSLQSNFNLPRGSYLA